MARVTQCCGVARRPSPELRLSLGVQTLTSRAGALLLRSEWTQAVPAAVSQEQGTRSPSNPSVQSDGGSGVECGHSFLWGFLQPQVLLKVFWVCV